MSEEYGTCKICGEETYLDNGICDICMKENYKFDAADAENDRRRDG